MTTLQRGDMVTGRTPLGEVVTGNVIGIDGDTVTVQGVMMERTGRVIAGRYSFTVARVLTSIHMS